MEDFVEECQFGNVKVRMITSNNVFIAKAIATKCRLLEPDRDGAMIEGKDFCCYTLKEILEKVDKIHVMASCTPNEKASTGLMPKKGHNVAIIGTRENDAPTLIKAHIGLSMGIQGTKIAKQHSNIFILEEKFETITIVLRHGRYVYGNIKKADLFQMTVNFVLFMIKLVAIKSFQRSQSITLKLVWLTAMVETLSVLVLSLQDPLIDRTEPYIIDNNWFLLF